MCPIACSRSKLFSIRFASAVFFWTLGCNCRKALTSLFYFRFLFFDSRFISIVVVVFPTKVTRKNEFLLYVQQINLCSFVRAPSKYGIFQKIELSSHINLLLCAGQTVHTNPNSLNVIFFCWKMKEWNNTIGPCAIASEREYCWAVLFVLL